MELGGREPHFTLVLGGEPLLTAASHTAPFHVLLLFLHAANTAHGVCPACDANAVASLELLQVLKGWCFNTGMARWRPRNVYSISAWQFCRRLGAAFPMHSQKLSHGIVSIKYVVTCAGAVGGRSLEYLRLASVLRPAGRVRNLFAGRWFGMWT